MVFHFKIYNVCKKLIQVTKYAIVERKNKTEKKSIVYVSFIHSLVKCESIRVSLIQSDLRSSVLISEISLHLSS